MMRERKAGGGCGGGGGGGYGTCRSPLRLRLRLRLRLLSVAVLLSCTASDGPDIVLTNATVELDAFSGRPNPRWELSVEEARDLSQRISGLEPARGASLPDVGLGYRGFYIDSVGSERVFISHGLIAFMRGGQPRVIYRDARGAEEALQAQARSRGLGAVIDRK
jgi:hypothetical protein